MVEIYLLKQLLTFQQCGTLSATAEKLHISQPALSRSMQKLEEELGVPLFERHKNKIQLNKNGLLAVQYATELIALEETMIRKLHLFAKRNSQIAIGSCALTPINECKEVIANISPDLTALFELLEEQELIDGLKQNHIHMAIMKNPLIHDEYISRQWFREQLVIALPPAHPLLENRNDISFNEMDGYNFLLLSPTGFWEPLIRSKLSHAHIVTHNESDILHELSVTSPWPTFKTTRTITKTPVFRNMHVLPITDPEATVTYYCVYKKTIAKKFESFFSYFDTVKNEMII